MKKLVWTCALLGLIACADADPDTGDGANNGANNGNNGANNGANNGNNGANNGNNGANNGNNGNNGANNGNGTCGPDDLDACLYLPGVNYDFEDPIEATITAPDRVGQPGRTFRVAIRKPIGAQAPLPIVITSHGGSSGKTNPIPALSEWAEFAARRGYLSVAIAHPLRSPEQGAALCEHLEATPDQCANFKFNNYDRPRDFARVVDELTALAETEAWRGEFDLSRIVYLGHSAGAGSTQMVAGACRSYYTNFVGDEEFCAPDPRPIAFVSLSPQGIGDDGFREGSWVDMDRPFLLATGRGDGGEDTGPVRRDGFYGSSGENQFMFYVDHIAAQHGVFGSTRPDSCLRETDDEALCDSMILWLRSTVAAFLAGVLEESPEARQWLQTDQIATAGAPHVQWETR
jgi:hypothetical protein